MMAGLVLGALALGQLPPAEDAPQGLGTIPVEPHVYGQWPFEGFPEQVVLNGRTFNLAKWSWPLYSGVQQQYREAVPTNSQHLMIYDDLSYDVQHMDEINPDAGNPLQHAVVDAPGATSAAMAALGFALGLVGGILLLRTL
jgi:hypothetical protein